MGLFVWWAKYAAFRDNLLWVLKCFLQVTHISFKNWRKFLQNVQLSHGFCRNSRSNCGILDDRRFGGLGKALVTVSILSWDRLPILHTIHFLIIIFVIIREAIVSKTIRFCEEQIYYPVSDNHILSTFATTFPNQLQ